MLDSIGTAAVAAGSLLFVGTCTHQTMLGVRTRWRERTVAHQQLVRRTDGRDDNSANLAQDGRAQPGGISPSQIGNLISIGAQRSVETIEERDSKEKDAEQKLFEEYHSRTLAYGDVLFWGSCAAAVFGLALIGWSFLEFTTMDVKSWQSAATALGKLITGTVIDGICILFIRQSQDARREAMTYYSDIIETKRCRDAVPVILQISNETLRGVMLAQIGAQMAGFKDNEVDLSCLLQAVKAEASTDT